ncbi:MAG: ABC transporter ATP-binding protein, partial [Bacteroidetes bacterium]|nr:ABC transporter ATP-binding protein [Bacteroidota bacterium]
MKIYFRVLSYIKPYRKQLTASIVFTILYSVFNGLSVYLSIPLLDTLFAQSGLSQPIKKVQPTVETHVFAWIYNIKDNISNYFQDLLFTGTKSEILFKICFLVFLAFFLKNIFGYLQSYFLAYVEQGMIRDIRNKAYIHLHKLPMSYFKNEKTGNLISRITNDINMLQNSVSAVFLNMIREPLSILVFLLIALSISWKLTLFSLLVLPVSIGVISWIGLLIRKQTHVLQEGMAEITTTLHETITGVKIVKAFGMEEYENKKFIKQTNVFYKLIIKIQKLRNASPHITEVLSVVVGSTMIYFGGQLVLVDKTLKAAEFFGFLFSIFQMMPPIKELSSVNNRIQESAAS